jgi:hypothetical protein
MNAVQRPHQQVAPLATGPVPLPASYWELYGPDAPRVWKLQRSRARDGIRRLTAFSGGDGFGEGAAEGRLALG